LTDASAAGEAKELALYLRKLGYVSVEDFGVVSSGT
jgi:hypothetical protein